MRRNWRSGEIVSTENVDETADILRDKQATRSIEKGLRDLRQGRFRRYENVDDLLQGIKAR